jgi:25S rRNA (adenine2142-N1)-methyltransferase
MPKNKKRKLPISNPLDNHVATSKPQSSRNVIRRFHVLIKKEAQLKCNISPSATEIEELVNIQHEIEELGGLQRYQRMSTVGQSNDRGGGSEKVFIEWMKELKLHVSETRTKLLCALPNSRVDVIQTYLHPFRLLEVGALKPDNFSSCISWIENTPVDLRPQHPAIREQDFLLLDPIENENKWDAISLSLVLNFVPLATDRGEA